MLRSVGAYGGKRSRRQLEKFGRSSSSDHAASSLDESIHMRHPGFTLAIDSFDVQRAGVRARRREGR
jgi:hypothetical protein